MLAHRGVSPRSHRSLLLECLVSLELEGLKVLKRSPDLLNNVKIGQSQLRLIIETYFVLPYMGGCSHFGQMT